MSRHFAVSASRMVRRFSTGASKTIPQAMMDIPDYNVHHWVGHNGGMFGPMGGGLEGISFGLVGGGQANLFLGYHLAKAGGDVTIFEAKSELGGRAECHTFSDGTQAPLGMMRFGKGQALWGRVVEELGYGFSGPFPDPGVAPTIIAYGNERTFWKGTDRPPRHFENVHVNYHRFLDNGWNGLVGWNRIREFLQNGKSDKATIAIQAWIDRFGGHTINQAVREIFALNWTNDDFRRFDTLGVGSGGYGVYGEKSFLILMRMMINGFEDDQRGVGAWNGREYAAVSPQDLVKVIGDKAREAGATIELASPVKSLSGNGYQLLLDTKEVYGRSFDHVVLGTTFPVMARIKGVKELIPDLEVFDTLANVDGGLSGKLFALVDISNIPGVSDPNFPLMLLIENNYTQQVYLMVYPDEGKALLLAWYGWERLYSDVAQCTCGELLDHCKKAIRSTVVGTQSEEVWKAVLDNIVEHWIKKWPEDEYALGAFHNPSKEYIKGLNKILHYWKSVEQSKGPRMYINSGDMHGAGGWNEGAYLSALTVASSIINDMGWLYNPELAPCNCINTNALKY